MTETRPSTRVVIESGIVPDAVLRQMQRWGFVPKDAVPDDTISDPQEIAERFQQAVEGESAVELRDSDLDAVKTYLSSQKRGRLYVPDVDGQMTFIEVYYGINKLGEYLIPWKSESIRDLLLDDRTYLKPQGASRTYFSDVRDLFFGSTKAFVVCTPAEARHG